MKIEVTDRDGSTRQIEGTVGDTLMETLRNEGFDDLLAVCGGCCSCATCHVYVHVTEPASLPPLTQDEDDLLNSVACRLNSSRLSCQVILDDGMSGLRVEIADED